MIIWVVAGLLVLTGLFIITQGGEGLGSLIAAMGVTIILVFVLLAVGKANAQHPNHDASHFYASWMMPDNRAVSCCHQQDCAASQSRMVNGKWQARWTDAEDWTDIPANKIETDRDSPDGQSHLCGRRYGFNGSTSLSVFCFLPASSG